VATEAKQQELRDKGAEFTAARDALARAQKYPVVMASPLEQKRLAMLNARASKLQQLIESVGKMIDGARKWFGDTFSLDLASDVPVANTAIDATIQSAIAGMNYFIRDARQELDSILKAQEMVDAAPDEQKKKMLGELQAQQPAAASPTFSKRTGAIVLAALGLLIWFSKGDDHEAY
jgi:Sec-independent protein translocase protein TatA